MINLNFEDSGKLTGIISLDGYEIGGFTELKKNGITESICINLKRKLIQNREFSNKIHPNMKEWLIMMKLIYYYAN